MIGHSLNTERFFLMVLVNNYVLRRVNLQLKLIVVLYIWNVTIYVSRFYYNMFVWTVSGLRVQTTYIYILHI